MVAILFSKKPEAWAIAKLLYQDYLWEDVEEYVRVLHLVVMIIPQWATYMRPWIGPKKLSILIGDKGDEEYERHMMI
jgi:hypothetical protein